MGKTLGFLGRELKKALPPTLFFMVVFHFAAVIRGLDEESFGITPGSSATATIAALILGKLIMVLDENRYINRWAGRPLIYSVVWKSLIFWLLASVLMFLEEMVPELRASKSLSLALQHKLSTVNWPRSWANHALLMVWLLIYCATAELNRTLGKGRLQQLFFSSGDHPQRTRPQS
jgi:uncharacterized membrane protein